jgi:hypothetical protein
MNDWVEEETYFDAQRYAKRHGNIARITAKKWSDGSSPIMLLKYEIISPPPEPKSPYAYDPNYVWNDYVSTITGNKLERRRDQFYWRGQSFHGLVDVKSGSLFDDPCDSFADHVGIKSSIALGYIKIYE